jgi:thioredoxin-dependent peroxiredoxin
MALKEGAKVPEFSLLDENEQTVTAKSLRGQNVVLFFYPKADTPG